MTRGAPRPVPYCHRNSTDASKYDKTLVGGKGGRREVKIVAEVRRGVRREVKIVAEVRSAPTIVRRLCPDLRLRPKEKDMLQCGAAARCQPRALIDS